MTAAPEPSRLANRSIAVLAGLALCAALAFAAIFSGASANGAGLVPDQVRTDTPVAVDGRVFDLAQFGDRVIVAGSFKIVQPSSNDAAIDQPYFYAYNIDTGALDQDFLIDFDGEVLGVVAAEDNSALYAVGAFKTVDGRTRKKVVRILPDGSVDKNFVVNANSRVTSVALSSDGSRLFLGGKFSKVGGKERAQLAEVDTATGDVVDSFTIGLSGPIGRGGAMTVKGMGVTPDGGTLVVYASARFIGDQDRWGLATIDLTANPAQVTPWRTRHYEDNKDRVGGQFMLAGFDLSPDGSYFVVTTSGGDRPPTNDTATRFPVAGGDGVQPDWITRNFDTTYSTAIDNDVVYIGGHFQYTEAPGAADPFPGDPNVSLGFGGNRNASELGSEVVARRQVAALDPATGHALNWDPGANGFNGVFALEVIDRGLLLGHDGDIVANKPVGRSAFFDRQNPGNGNQGGVANELDAAFTSPFDGSVVDTGTSFEITGIATAPEGIKNVQITVQDLSSKTWMQPDGSFATKWGFSDASLVAPGATESAWSIPIVLPASGRYRVKARVFDNIGAKDQSQPSIRIEALGIVGGGDDAPDTLLFTPEVIGNTVSVNGQALDDIGVTRVRVVYRLTENQNNFFIQADGSLDRKWHAFSAELADPGQTGTNWSHSATVPKDGSWLIQTWAQDTAGQKDKSKGRARITVGGTGIDPNDGLPSTPIVTLPKADVEIVAGGPFLIEGQATDDVAVDRVTVRATNVSTGEGPQLGGVLTGIDGLTAFIDASLTSPGAPSTAWSLSTPSLPPGRYFIETYTYDTAGQRSPRQSFHISVVREAGEKLPTAAILEPVQNSESDVPQLEITGTATDNQGTSRVEIGLFFEGTPDQRRGWLRADGVLSTNQRFFNGDATVVSALTPSTTWSYPVELPFEGIWRVHVRSWDNLGQPSSTLVWHRVTWRPSNAPPTVEVQSLSNGDTIVPGPLAVGGAIYDDSAVQRVRYYVRRTYLNEGPNPNPNISTANWFDAFVTQPGGTRSEYLFTTQDLAPGSWFLYAQPQDASGVWGERIRVDFTVEIPNNEAPTSEILNPVRGLSITDPVTTVNFNGTASDDKGVDEVRLVIYDHTRRGYVLADGSTIKTSADAYLNASLASPGATETTWSYDIDLLLSGRYSLYSFTYDSDGMRQLLPDINWFDFTPGDALPEGALLTPVNGATIGTSVTTTGIATDDVGIDRVIIRYLNRLDSTQHLRADGSYGAYEWIEVDITPGTTVDWSNTVQLKPGQWNVQAYIIDTSGKGVYVQYHSVTVE